MDKRNMIDRIFPVKYKFYEMLYKQAHTNGLGVNALFNWVKNGSVTEGEALIHFVKEADKVRKNMEKDLIEAFTTPFDRGDIYSISVGMHEVLKYAESSLLSMEAFGVEPNSTIINMVEQLKRGVDIFSESVNDLERNPGKAEQAVAGMRETHIEIEKLYRNGMIAVFASNDPMNALKQREVYHHIKDASSNLEETVDVLHRIIVRLI